MRHSVAGYRVPPPGAPQGVGEDEAEAVLDRVMMLFRYLQEKDVFEKYYKQHLSKRLLSGRTVSDEAERSLLVKLKTECGYQVERPPPRHPSPNPPRTLQSRPEQCDSVLMFRVTYLTSASSGYRPLFDHFCPCWLAQGTRSRP